jgi:uncharacterized membrane protein
MVSATVALLTAVVISSPVLAQDADEPQESPAQLTVFAEYPVRVTAAGDSVTFELILRGTAEPETVHLDVENLPEGWTATFRGGGDVIQAAHVEPENGTSVDLSVEVPEDVPIDTYHFSVIARSGNETIEVPIGVSVEEEVPPSLTLEVDLPTLKGKANTSFSYDATLKNEGDDELSVNLIAEAPADFQVDFKLTGKEVSPSPRASQSASISRCSHPMMHRAAPTRSTCWPRVGPRARGRRSSPT